MSTPQPSAASSVGPLALPVPAGAEFSAIDDPTLSGLAAYFAFWLNFDLNTKLASLQTSRPPPDGSLITTAVPAGNVFCWNPLKPNAFFTRGKGDDGAHPLPALYVWDDADKGKGWSQLHGMRERQVKAAWIFEEGDLPDWLQDRYGLRGTARATLERAAEEKWHPGYNPNASIAVQLCLAGDGIVYQGSESGMISPRPDGVKGSDQPKVRAYPTAIASFLVYERVDGFTQQPSTATPDLKVVTATGDDPQNAVVVGGRIVPAPPYETTT